VAAGKPPYGTVSLSAAQRGDRVQICIEDDGRGLDPEAIRSAAVSRGLLSAERDASLEPAAVLELIFHPGFTTRSSVSSLSGRGVGLDVVRDHVQRLGGTISTSSTPGAGTRFVITVPLTLATTRVLLVEDAGQTLAIPSSAIQRTGRAQTTDLLTIEGRRALQLDGRAVPVVELSAVLGSPQDSERDPSSQAWRSFVVLTHSDRAVALLTDRLVDQQELVVKGLEAPLRRVKHVAGAAVLATGNVAVVLNPTDLTKTALASIDSGTLGRWSRATSVASPEESPRRRILLVDDSVMTRTLERSILEAAGYEALVAGDGLQALEVLAANTVDAIISDVEMPRMTGLELTSAVRQDERLRHLPVVLVTSLDTPEQIERGAAAGADAYIVKGRFDQGELLDTLGRLL
jgi:two-component system chemotaxis sensor kinase CheA